MEFYYDVKNMATEEVLKVDHTLTPEGHEANDDLKKKMEKIIDQMGKVSSISQWLHPPITSAEKLVNSDHIVYLITEHNTRYLTVIGILRMAWKKLDLIDKSGLHLEAMVYCMMDFYVHHSRHRQGYGIRLFKYMLQDVNLEAKDLAMEKPTKKLFQFMWKHYRLFKLLNQWNNFVIYVDFFEDTLDGKNNSSSSGHRASAYMRHPMYRRYGALKHHDTMGEVVQGEGEVQIQSQCGINRPPVQSGESSS